MRIHLLVLLRVTRTRTTGLSVGRRNFRPSSDLDPKGMRSRDPTDVERTSPRPAPPVCRRRPRTVKKSDRPASRCEGTVKIALPSARSAGPVHSGPGLPRGQAVISELSKSLSPFRSSPSDGSALFASAQLDRVSCFGRALGDSIPYWRAACLSKEKAEGE